MSEMDRLLGSEIATKVKQAKAIDQVKGLTQGEVMMVQEMKKQRIYSKEATAITDIRKVHNGEAEDIIRAIKEKVGVEKNIAVRPKTNKQYEVTFETEEVCDGLINGLQIKGQICDVKILGNMWSHSCICLCILMMMILPQQRLGFTQERRQRMGQDLLKSSS